jgi:hypothetical protein
MNMYDIRQMESARHAYVATVLTVVTTVLYGTICLPIKNISICAVFSP